MSYESNLFVVERTEYRENLNGVELETPIVFCNMICSFNLCSCGMNTKIFDKPLGCELYISDEGVTEDKYGGELKYTTLQVVIDEVKRLQEKDPYYRRFAPCLALLNSFNLKDWNNSISELVVVHYGH